MNHSSVSVFDGPHVIDQIEPVAPPVYDEHHQQPAVSRPSCPEAGCLLYMLTVRAFGYEAGRGGCNDDEDVRCIGLVLERSDTRAVGYETGRSGCNDGTAGLIERSHFWGWF
jgi:hypothetical protein